MEDPFISNLCIYLPSTVCLMTILGIENAFENELDVACAFGTIHRCMQHIIGIDISHKHMYVMAQ